MRLETFDLLRCPFCGGTLSLVESMYHRRTASDLTDGVLGCQCCLFPVVDGIPVMHLRPNANAARAHIEAGRPDLALRAMIGIEAQADAERFDEAARLPSSTYRTIVEAIGAGFEGGYFLYRFSDPTYIVAQALVRAVAGDTLQGRGRAIDVCGGSGHLTRTLLELSSAPPVLADLYFAKIWLARRFTAPGCEPVCCDGNGAFPFARGVFDYAMCSDAFMFIWTKRLFVGEMARLVDRPSGRGTIMISHTHNQLTWSPSHGQPLTPDGYRNLFERAEPRVFAEQALFRDVVAGGPLDLSRRDTDAVLNGDPALTIISSADGTVFRRHELERPAAARGIYRVNPLYQATANGSQLHLRLYFPDRDYEDEYGASRAYLPDETSLDREALHRLEAGGPIDELIEPIRRRIVVDLPKNYY